MVRADDDDDAVRPAVHSSSVAESAVVPDWAADAVFYQIFPERFANGDPTNDPTRESLESPDIGARQLEDFARGPATGTPAPIGKSSSAPTSSRTACFTVATAATCRA